MVQSYQYSETSGKGADRALLQTGVEVVKSDLICYTFRPKSELAAWW